MEVVKIETKSKTTLKSDSNSRLLKRLYRDRFLYMMILPGIALYILFSYVPMYGIILAFKKYMINKGIWGSPWNGLSNFAFIIGKADFITAFKNTFIISFGKLLFGFPAPIILALLLNELRNKYYKRTIQTLIYLPHFLSWVIVYGLFFNIFSSSIGVLSKFLISIGQEPISILGNPKYFRTILYATGIWKGMGWGSIIYLAAIMGIDPSLYESAIIDGANRFKQMLYITLPSLKYAVILLLILDLGHVMDAGFDQIFNFYSVSTYSVGDIIDTYVYRLGIVSGRFDLSTAVGVFKSVLNFILLITANKVVKLFGEEGLF